MCARFTLTIPSDVIARLFDVEAVPKLPLRYNIAPSQPIVGVRASDSGAREAALLQWGLIPHWAKQMGAGLINARSETAAEKPSFRTPFRRRRCLIPATGFFEWRRLNGRKQPYYIRMEDGSPFAMAGIWDVWQRGEEAYIESCALLTVAPNETVRPIHDRMPVILRPDDWDIWLDPRNQRPEELASLLRPYDAGPMVAFPVSRHVNNPRNDDPSCLTPLDDPQASIFR